PLADIRRVTQPVVAGLAATNDVHYPFTLHSGEPITVFDAASNRGMGRMEVPIQGQLRKPDASLVFAVLPGMAPLDQQRESEADDDQSESSVRSRPSWVQNFEEDLHMYAGPGPGAEDLGPVRLPRYTILMAVAEETG